MEFEWDPEKLRANIKKHEVHFKEAVEVFKDANRLVDIDDRESYGEERLRVIGMSLKRLLTVVCVERGTSLTRIISARKAAHAEEARYFGEWDRR
ncbi:MAG: BrnT family toxin [Parvularculaceae bacterium]